MGVKCAEINCNNCNLIASKYNFLLLSLDFRFKCLKHEASFCETDSNAHVLLVYVIRYRSVCVLLVFLLPNQLRSSSIWHLSVQAEHVSQFLPLLLYHTSFFTAMPHCLWDGNGQRYWHIACGSSSWQCLECVYVCVVFEALCQCKMLRICVMAHSQAWWAITQMLGCNITAVDGQHWSSSQMGTALGLSPCPHAAPPYGVNPPALLAPGIASL